LRGTPYLHALARLLGPVWRRLGRRVAQCEALALQMAGSLSSAVANKATQAQDAQKKKAARVVTGGALLAGLAHHFAGAGKPILFAILGAAGLVLRSRSSTPGANSSARMR
jgi:hypothetical protein